MMICYRNKNEDSDNHARVKKVVSSPFNQFASLRSLSSVGCSFWSQIRPSVRDIGLEGKTATSKLVIVFLLSSLLVP